VWPAGGVPAGFSFYKADFTNKKTEKDYVLFSKHVII